MSIFPEEMYLRKEEIRRCGIRFSIRLCLTCSQQTRTSVWQAIHGQKSCWFGNWNKKILLRSGNIGLRRTLGKLGLLHLCRSSEGFRKWCGFLHLWSSNDGSLKWCDLLKTNGCYLLTRFICPREFERSDFEHRIPCNPKGVFLLSKDMDISMQVGAGWHNFRHYSKSEKQKPDCLWPREKVIIPKIGRFIRNGFLHWAGTSRKDLQTFRNHTPEILCETSLKDAAVPACSVLHLDI